VNKSYDSLNC